MKRWMTLLLGCLLLCTACGKKELLGSIALREDTTPEQMIEELSQRYDLPESMLLESAADLAALLQIKEKYLLLGCGRIAAPEDNPQQILLAQAAPGKTEKVTATLQKRLETVQRAFPEYPSAQAGGSLQQGIMLFWSSSPPMIWILCSRRLWIILSEGNSKKKLLHTNLNSCIIS